MENVLIEFQKLFSIQSVLFRAEIVQVPDKKPTGISDPSVGLGKALQDFIGDPDIVLVILGSDPQPEYLGSVLPNNLVRGDNVSDRFGHFLPLPIDHESMGEDVLIRGYPPCSHRG